MPQRFYLVSDLTLGIFDYGESLYNCLGNNIIKGNLADYRQPLVKAIIPNLARVIFIKVIFVDAN
ncbi:hypothetical protein ACFLUK_02535 [Chloroflexota bacterium]